MRRPHTRIQKRSLTCHDGLSGRHTCEHVRALVTDCLDEIEERLADLNRTRTELLAIAERLDNLEPADCTNYCTAIQ